VARLSLEMADTADLATQAGFPHELLCYAAAFGCAEVAHDLPVDCDVLLPPRAFKP
jgi:hypothetical protein